MYQYDYNLSRVTGLLMVVCAVLLSTTARGQACNAPSVDLLSPSDGATAIGTDQQLTWELREVADDFEDGDLDEYTEVDDTADPIHAATANAARYGNFGLSSMSTYYGLGWLVRDDLEVANAQGSTISVWIYPHDGNGRTYFGFGATTSRAYAVELQSNANKFVISKWSSSLSLSVNLGSTNWSFSAQWYRVEIDWAANGGITARLYDSDGTTLLRTVTGNDTAYTSGGIAFRSFETSFSKPSYFDEVEILQTDAVTEQYIPGPRSSWTAFPNEARDLDAATGAYRYEDSAELNAEPTAQQTMSTDVYEETLVTNPDMNETGPPIARATQGGSCGGTVIDFDDIPASGYTLWDGNRYAPQGVVFSTGAGAALYAFNSSFYADTDPNYVLGSTTGFYSNSKVVATFTQTVNCVSVYIVDGEPAGSNFTIAVYDEQGNALETLVENVDSTRYRFQHAGIKKLEFTPSADIESIDTLQFTTEDCAQTYDVYFGTSPGSMSLIAEDIETTTADPGPLNDGTTYYWQVVSTDCCGEYTSDIWSFTTEEPEPEPQPSSEVWVDFGFGGLELGTQANPFNSIAEAMTYLIIGGTITFKGDVATTTTTETPIINTDATLDAVGGSVTIGAAP